MISSLALSIDMSTLTVTDTNGTKTDFDLSANDGVLIKLTSNGLLVGNPKNKPAPDVTVSTVNAQWQISFHDPKDLALLVGSINIDVSRTPQDFAFDLNTGDLQLWKEGTNLKAKLV